VNLRNKEKRMNQKTKEIISREILESCPEGAGIVRTERITVKIIWPGNKPQNENVDYHKTGNWKIL
jgi:hypothetical protein